MLINIDDYENTEDDSFDPDLKEFYDSNTLPSHIWNPKIMARPEIHEKILQNTKFQNQKPDPNFSFKVKIFLSKKFIRNFKYSLFCGRSLNLIEN